MTLFVEDLLRIVHSTKFPQKHQQIVRPENCVSKTT